MNTGRLVLAQLLDLLPMHEFHRCVLRYRGNFHCRRFTCYDQFLTLAFAQLTYRESLRDIETCLRALDRRLYHAGLRARVARNTLAKANEKRDWRIWADFAQIIIARARRLYAEEPFGVELKQTAYALDSTTIDLCLRLFPWAHFRRRKGAVKLHTLLDLRGSIPCFILLTHGKINEVHALDLLPLEPGAFYVFDRGYTDFARLLRLHPSLGLLRHARQAPSGLSLLRVAPRRQEDRPAMRSDHPSEGTRIQFAPLSDAPAPHRLLRRRDGNAAGLPDQQLRPRRIDHSASLPRPLEDRAVLQMDQTVPPDQDLLRHLRERSQDAGLGCRLRLRPRGHPEEGTRPRAIHGRDSANSQPHTLRENAHISKVLSQSPVAISDPTVQKQLSLFTF